jgi:hypothetical protein
MAGQTVWGFQPLLWEGPSLESGKKEELEARLDVPAGGKGLLLEVSIDNPDWDAADFSLAVETPDGQTLEGTGWVSYTVMVPQPMAGTYKIAVESISGKGPYQGVVQIESDAPVGGPVRDLLPNLVTLPPIDLRIESSDCFYVVITCAPSPLPALGIKGCQIYEVAEEQVRRCLRFSNKIGNIGEGPFEILLDPEQALLSYAGQGRWLQRIYTSDGQFRDEPVGSASFHATHFHHHFDGMAAYSLYAYDVDAGRRGEKVSEGRKVGFCFIDMGLVELGLNNTRAPRYGYEHTEGCGLSPNWYDMYWWSLDEQFIDVTNVGDGVYELVSTANAAGAAIESNAQDNAAHVIFKMTGDKIEVMP